MKKVVKLILFGIIILYGIFMFVLMLQINGWRAFNVMSASMEPTIITGTLVFVKKIPSNELKIGDIITFIPPNQKSLTVTHRIVEVNERAESVSFNTKGDRNKNQDQWTIYDSSIVGIVSGKIPYVGYIYSFLSSKIGILLLIVLPSLWLIIDSINDIVKIIKKYKYKKTNLTAPLLLLLMVSSLHLQPHSTYALLSDTATLSQSKFMVQVSQKSPALSIFLSGDKKAVLFTTKDIEGYKTLEYLMTYSHDLPQIREGSSGIEDISGKTFTEKTLILGTCSEKSCVYHSRVRDIVLEVVLTDITGKKITLRGNIENSADPDDFPSCNAPFGNIIASYDYGKHEIIGVGLLTGGDVVYSLDTNKYKVLQCFCPLSGRGIQTNWIRTDDIEGYKYKGFPFSIKSGSSWNLDSGSYAAQNVEYECRE